MPLGVFLFLFITIIIIIIFAFGNQKKKAKQEKKMLADNVCIYSSYHYFCSYSFTLLTP